MEPRRRLAAGGGGDLWAAPGEGPCDLQGKDHSRDLQTANPQPLVNSLLRVCPSLPDLIFFLQNLVCLNP